MDSKITIFNFGLVFFGLAPFSFDTFIVTVKGMSLFLLIIGETFNKFGCKLGTFDFLGSTFNIYYN